jgi:hypothetical protein
MAAQGYFNISCEDGLEQQESQDLFNKAVVCGILAPSGARKARTLTVLMKDERCKMNPFYDLVSKMTLGMVIREKDSKEFEGQLDTH